jgi:hypothetical protein
MTTNFPHVMADLAMQALDTVTSFHFLVVALLLAIWLTLLAGLPGPGKS